MNACITDLKRLWGNSRRRFFIQLLVPTLRVTAIKLSVKSVHPECQNADFIRLGLAQC